MPEPVSCTEPTADDHATNKGKACVTFRLQLVVVNASGHEHVQEVARIEPDEVVMETLGLAWPGGTIPGICTLRVIRPSIPVHLYAKGGPSERPQSLELAINQRR